jgi:hypothetical protein
MGKVVLSMTMSLEESIQNTGVVVMGRNSYAMVEDPDWFAWSYEYQAPIFVLTHHSPWNFPQAGPIPSFAS